VCNTGMERPEASLVFAACFLGVALKFHELYLTGTLLDGNLNECFGGKFSYFFSSYRCC